MRYFLDVEFNGFGGELISLALVPEADDMPPFYGAVRCAQPTPWVSKHVLPVLNIEPVDRATIARHFETYLGDDPDPLLIADWPEVIAHAAMLMVIAPGRRMALDRIRFEMLDSIGFDSAAMSAVPHNAYHDAMALRTYTLSREL